MDPVLLIGSGVAIAILVGINAALGGWRRPALSSLDEARALLAVEAHTFSPGKGALAVDGRAALFQDADTPAFALVAARGDRWVARQFPASAVRRARLNRKGELVLHLADFTFTPITLRLPPDELSMWRGLLTSEEPAAHAEPA